MVANDTALDIMNSALDAWPAARQRSSYDDLSDLKDGTLPELVTTLSTTINMFAPPGSDYVKQAAAITDAFCPHSYHSAHQPLYGVLKSLRDAYEKGYLTTIAEIIHADLFNDFLEMAEHLLDQGYKDPAAVLVGGTLEEHLRKLCTKHGIPITNAKGQPQKASAMNDDLAKTVYDKLQQKGVTYWLDLRNKAAHGEYSEYDTKDVQSMLHSVREFISRFRA